MKKYFYKVIKFIYEDSPSSKWQLYEPDKETKNIDIN